MEMIEMIEMTEMTDWIERIDWIEMTEWIDHIYNKEGENRLRAGVRKYLGKSLQKDFLFYLFVQTSMTRHQGDES